MYAKQHTKNPQKGFIIPLLLVIIAILLIGGGVYTGVYTYQHFSQATSTTQIELTKTILDARSIASAINKPHPGDYTLIIDQNMIVFGDLDEDGINEAVAPVSWCSASCGLSIYAFKSYQGKVLSVEIRETQIAGAAQAINSLQIKNGTIVVTETDFDGTRTNSYQVRLVDGNLVAKPLR